MFDLWFITYNRSINWNENNTNGTYGTVNGCVDSLRKSVKIRCVLIIFFSFCFVNKDNWTRWWIPKKLHPTIITVWWQYFWNTLVCEATKKGRFNTNIFLSWLFFSPLINIIIKVNWHTIAMEKMELINSKMRRKKKRNVCAQ